MKKLALAFALVCGSAIGADTNLLQKVQSIQFKVEQLKTALESKIYDLKKQYEDDLITRIQAIQLIKPDVIKTIDELEPEKKALIDIQNNNTLDEYTKTELQDTLNVINDILEELYEPEELKEIVMIF